MTDAEYEMRLSRLLLQRKLARRARQLANEGLDIEHAGLRKECLRLIAAADREESRVTRQIRRLRRQRLS